MRKLKALAVAMVLVLALLGLAACSGGGGDGEKKESKKEYVTMEDYNKLKEQKWTKMTLEEVNQVLGMEGVFNEEATARKQENQKVYQWPGKDGKGYINILFMDKEGDGKYTPGSMGEVDLGEE